MAEMPDDVMERGADFASALRLELANGSGGDHAARLWASPGVIELMNRSCRKALLAERAAQREKDAGILDDREQVVRRHPMFPAFGLESEASAYKSGAAAIREQKP